MRWLEAAFDLCAAVVLWTYLGYPLALALWARLFRRPIQGSKSGGVRSVSIVLAAYNEAHHIERRLEELTALVEAAGLEGEIIVVSDGSTDETAGLARSWVGRSVRVLELPVNEGKAAALSRGCALARHQVLVFTDARQTWAPDALECLLRNFRDPQVGAVSGNLVLQSADGVLRGVGLYWRFEKWLRQQESQVWAQVGVSGSISAVRRELFRPIPRGTILDDVYWPMQVVLQGYRVVLEEQAHAYDRLPVCAGEEFRRKVRTLSGNFQLLARQPSLLLPWRNPVWAALVSHKLFRLLAPWALLALVPLSWFMPGNYFRLFFLLQLYFYVLGLGGLCGLPGRLPAAAVSFLVLNGAAWTAFWVWGTGQTNRSWRKAVYRCPAEGPVVVQEPAVRDQESGIRSQEPGIRSQEPAAFLTPDS